MQLIKLINKFFSTNLTSSLDLYIQSKNPTNVADVEHLTKEYFDKVNLGYFC
jgi:hypothetical protein